MRVDGPGLEGRRDHELDGGKDGGCSFALPGSEDPGRPLRTRGCCRGQRRVAAADGTGVKETWRRPRSVRREGWLGGGDRAAEGAGGSLAICSAARAGGCASCSLITLATDVSQPASERRILNCPRVSVSGDRNRAGCRALVGVDLRMWVLPCQEKPCGW